MPKTARYVSGKHIAEFLGFHNHFHFLKTFNDKMLLSPLSYRRRCQTMADADATERSNRPP